MVDPNASTEALPDPLPTEEREGLPADLGGCRIVREIGRCGMGIVFEAIQHSPRRPVALKVMRSVKPGASFDRFLNEAQILAELRHPSITQVYRSGIHEQDGQRVPWFVMEYVPNARSLTDHARERDLPLRDRIALFLDVCDAVHHAHQSKGIVHRDLKPDNILVDGDGRVKVIDFGIAKALGGDLSLRRMESEFGQVLGTLPYMAPEQVEADPREVDARCDVYGLGIVLYELLCGAKPYVVPRRPLTDAIRVIRTEPPKAPRRINPDVRGDLATILLGALVKDRRRRYQSVAALADDLRRFLDGRPIGRSPASPLRRTLDQVRSFAIRRPAIATISGILLTLMIVPALAAPVVYRWTDVDARYVRFLTTRFAPTATTDRLADVRVVRASEEACDALAARLGLEGVSARDRVSFRLLHGRLLERLAEAGASVVLFDIAFPYESDHDEAFLRGVSAVRADDADGPGDVVVAVVPWPTVSPTPLVSPDFLPAVTWGGITVRVPDDAALHEAESPVTAEIAVQRGNADPIPHATLAAALAHRYPGRYVKWRIDAGADDDTIVVRVHDRPREEAAVAAYEFTVPFAVTAAATEPESADPLGQQTDLGIDRDDLVVDVLASIPGDAELDACTVAYADVFTMDDAAARRTFGDRVVLVAPIVSEHLAPDDPAADMHRISRTRSVHGVELHAAVLDLLLRKAIIRAAPPDHVLAMDFSAAALGELAAWGTGRRRWRRLVLAVAIVSIVCGLALLAYDRAAYLVNPLVPLVTLLAAMLLTGWIVEARARALR